MNSENKLSGEIKIKQRSGLTILFWLLLFAPLGLYLLWKEKRLHGWFPDLLLFFGFLNIVPVAVMMLFIYPKLIKLYKELNADFNTNTIIFFAVIVLLFSFVEVVTGFFLKKKVKNEGFLKNSFILLCLLFFVFQYIPFSLMMRSFVLGMIMPMYTLTSSFEISSTPIPTNQPTKKILYSPSALYVVSQDISGGIDSMLKVYSVKYNDTLQLDVFGTSNIFDIMFLPNDKLIVLFGYKGIYNEQYLKIFDVPGLFSNYPLNVNKQYKYFTNLAQYSNQITLPDMGEDYQSLVVSDNKLKVQATHGAFKEYNLEELSK